jgi:hypothetical protein
VRLEKQILFEKYAKEYMKDSTDNEKLNQIPVDVIYVQKLKIRAFG